MRRRRLFTLASVLSLLLCFGIVILWVRSYWYVLSLSHYGSHSRVDFAIAGGKFVFYLDDADYGTAGEWMGGSSPWVDDPSYPFRPHPFLGFYFQVNDGTDGQSHEFGIPLWFVLLCCSTSFWMFYRKSSAAKDGVCPACDYDLTGNTSGTCPECGTPVPRESDAGA